MGKIIDLQDVSVSKNRGKTSQIIHFNRVFHYFHHPFWGVKSPYFWFNTHVLPVGTVQAGLSIGDPWQYDATSLLRPASLLVDLPVFLFGCYKST